MKIHAVPLLRRVAPALLACAFVPCAHATAITQTGTFTADNDLATYNFTLAAAENVSIYTTSYGGGANLDGTTSAAGGFVPNLSLFTGTGAIVAGEGGLSMCGGGANADGVTGLCNDASLSKLLGPGAYELVLSEFPNVAINNLSDGFLFSSDPSATGDACGGANAGKMFLDTTVAPCVQRDGNYAYNIATSSPVPEPATWTLVLPGAGMLLVAGRRYLA